MPGFFYEKPSRNQIHIPKLKRTKLILEDNTEFAGISFGYEGSAAGEVVFNTAMTGYPESLTDPSYRGQILTLTYPLIGNYGVPGDIEENNLSRYFESDRVQVSGLIIADYSEQYFHWNANQGLGDWLRKNKVPALSGIDTRRLTRHLRENGAMLGKIVIDRDVDFRDPNLENLTAQVSTSKVISYGNGAKRIVLLDLGVKNNIIRQFLKHGVTVIRVPWDYDYSEIQYDGLFLSNGPGNPKMCGAAIEHVAKAIRGNKPVFGICLGNQIIALASGADTYKLRYGHRSHNQPVLKCGTNQAYITSQNHGFAIDNDTLGQEWEPLFVNLNDGTNEGLRHKSKPIFSVQFHPEASGGPTDTEFLFDEFLDLVNLHSGK